MPQYYTELNQKYQLQKLIKTIFNKYAENPMANVIDEKKFEI